MIESAALYSIFALVFIITYALNNPINQVFMGVASFVQVSLHSPTDGKPKVDDINTG